MHAAATADGEFGCNGVETSTGVVSATHCEECGEKLCCNGVETSKGVVRVLRLDSLPDVVQCLTTLLDGRVIVFTGHRLPTQLHSRRLE